MTWASLSLLLGLKAIASQKQASWSLRHCHAGFRHGIIHHMHGRWLLVLLTISLLNSSMALLTQAHNGSHFSACLICATNLYMCTRYVYIDTYIQHVTSKWGITRNWIYHPYALESRGWTRFLSCWEAVVAVGVSPRAPQKHELESERKDSLWLWVLAFGVGRMGSGFGMEALLFVVVWGWWPRAPHGMIFDIGWWRRIAFQIKQLRSEA